MESQTTSPDLDQIEYENDARFAHLRLLALLPRWLEAEALYMAKLVILIVRPTEIRIEKDHFEMRLHTVEVLGWLPPPEREFIIGAEWGDWPLDPDRLLASHGSCFLDFRPEAVDAMRRGARAWRFEGAATDQATTWRPETEFRPPDPRAILTYTILRDCYSRVHDREWDQDHRLPREEP